MKNDSSCIVYKDPQMVSLIGYQKKWSRHSIHQVIRNFFSPKNMVIVKFKESPLSLSLTLSLTLSLSLSLKSDRCQQINLARIFQTSSPSLSLCSILCSNKRDLTRERDQRQIPGQTASLYPGIWQALVTHAATINTGSVTGRRSLT